MKKKKFNPPNAVSFKQKPESTDPFDKCTTTRGSFLGRLVPFSVLRFPFPPFPLSSLYSLVVVSRWLNYTREIEWQSNLVRFSDRNSSYFNWVDKCAELQFFLLMASLVSISISLFLFILYYFITMLCL